LLLNCVVSNHSDADSDNDKQLNGKERLHGMGVIQLLTIMCSSAQNAVSVLAIDTLCQLVSLPVISLHPAPLDTRSTRVYIAQLEAVMKSTWGSTAIKTLRDSFIAADSRSAARSAALSLYTIYRDTWGNHWYIFVNVGCIPLLLISIVFRSGTQPHACWAAMPRF
jgi:hypothetical protein